MHAKENKEINLSFFLFQYIDNSTSLGWDIDTSCDCTYSRFKEQGTRKNFLCLSYLRIKGELLGNEGLDRWGISNLFHFMIVHSVYFNELLCFNWMICPISLLCILLIEIDTGFFLKQYKTMKVMDLYIWYKLVMVKSLLLIKTCISYDAS